MNIIKLSRMIVGLMGIKRSGKDTAADYLVEHHNYLKSSFAEPLKEHIGKGFFMFSDQQLYGNEQQKEAPDPRWDGNSCRQILQFVGTELFRDGLSQIMPTIGKDIHIHNFRLRYQEMLKTNPNVRIVIPDVRFRNEMEFIKSMGGKVIKIDRPCVLTGDSHASEVELQSIKDYDFLIHNTGTIADLYQQLENCICS